MVELNVTASTQGVTANITYRATVVCAVPTPTPQSNDAGQSSANATESDQS
jgi:hypothetical protein